jgi:cell division septal protein FtsQ
VKRRWLILGAVGLAGLLVLAGPPLLRNLEFFRVRRVEVLGARYLSGGQVMAALRLDPDHSLFDGTDPLARRVFGILGVRESKVTRRWPGTLVVRVVEWEPVALTPADAGLSLLDVRGRVLPFDPTRSPADLPLAPADPAVARLLARLRDAEPEVYADVLTARRVGDDVILDTGPRRYLLRSEATVEELHALAAVAADLARKGRTWRELDARYAERILVRGMSS